MGWMGAALWHTEPGTEASTDGCCAARLQGDSHSTFRMAVSQRAARERGKGQKRRGTPNAGQEVEGERILSIVYCQNNHQLECCIAALWETKADFSVARWSSPVYIPLHALAQGYYGSNGHWLHGDQTTGATLQLQVGLPLTIKRLVYKVSENRENHSFVEIKVTSTLI